MKSIIKIALIAVFCISLVAGCRTSENNNQNNTSTKDSKGFTEMADIKMMIIPMRKDPISGILDAVSDGMPTDGGGYEAKYVDILSNETTLTLELKYRMLIILPANQTTPYHWTDLTTDESVVSLTVNEYVTDNNPDKMVGVGGHRIFEILAIAPGKTVVSTKQVHVADEDDFDEEFKLEVVVE